VLNETDVIHQGIALRRAGQLAEAADRFVSVLTANPANEWARIELANDLRAAGKTPDAKRILQEGVSLGRRCPNLRVSLAEILATEGDIAQAHKALVQATEEAPQSSKGYVALMTHLAGQGDFDQALATASNALAFVTAPEQRAFVLKEAAAVLGLRHADQVDVKEPVQRYGAPLDNCLYVTLVKDEGDIMLRQLEHHFGLGFRYFAIANNASSDNTEEQIKAFRAKYSDASVLYVEDPIVAHQQDVKLTSLARFAIEYFQTRKAKLEWVFPLDGDEFICVPDSMGDLQSILGYVANQNKTVIAYHLCNMATERPIADLPPAQDLWSIFTVRSHYRRRPVSKVAYRYSPEAKLELGSHFVQSAANSVQDIWPAASAGIYLAHHPYRTVTQIRSKVLNGGRAVSMSRELGGGHWRDYYERYKVEGEELFPRILQNYINTTKQNSA
jgi:tetratricopeptide (TPR) repeat protein